MVNASTCLKKFESLNAQQRTALYASPNSVLQVVAGPGTGKTHLITCRVAYLLTVHRLDPRKLIVTTFTKKASIEMKERLTALLSENKEIDLGALFIGTFHSICLKFLRLHGDKIGFKSFSIADEADQSEFFKKAMDDAGIESRDQKDFKKGYLSYISKQKALGLLPEECRPKLHSENHHFNATANKIYELYQDFLRVNNKLDFDDILLYTNKLFDKHPECTSFVEHVLIDEFQDTNTIQLKLLYQLAKNCNDNITVVGDADQSIYGFRNAEYSNFECMEEEFKRRKRNMIKVILDQNYRSTERILIAAEKLMRHQHQKRVPKELKSNSNLTSPIIVTTFERERHETDNIAALIKHYSNEGIESKNYGFHDFAIICRMRKTFRMVEMALLHAGIPYVIIKGTSFWEMKEIKMATDILRCVVSDYDWLSFKRILTWYVDNLGPTSIANIEAIVFSKLQNEEQQVDIMEILRAVANSELKVRATNKAKKNLLTFLDRLEMFRKFTRLDEDAKEFSIDDRKKLFNNVIIGFSVIQIATKLKTTKDKDPEPIARDIENNVQEFRNQFCQFNPLEDEILMKEQRKLFGIDGDLLKESKSWRTFLSLFLDEIYIYSTLQINETEGDDAKKPKVTICTIHASKGLEWPIVFIPSLVEGVFPVALNGAEVSEEMANAQEDEERRCFYVGITRGKHVVHLSTRESDSGFIPVAPSKFLTELGDEVLVNMEPIVEPRDFENNESTLFNEIERDGTNHSIGFTTAFEAFSANINNHEPPKVKLEKPKQIKLERLFEADGGDVFSDDDAEVGKKPETLVDDTFSDGDTEILNHNNDAFSDDDDDNLILIQQLNKIAETSKESAHVHISGGSATSSSPPSASTVNPKEEKKKRKNAAEAVGDKNEVKETKGRSKKKTKPALKTIRPLYPSIDLFFKPKANLVKEEKVLEAKIDNDLIKKESFNDDEIDIDEIFD